ncbi:hypothetical protein WL99_22320 [Burkholderia cepacia]|uniref:YodC family protein n=1 Tax=Burkholderia cepacia TaxID=292 RepID=UPI00075D2A1E|nr:DUF2158 domain-containing protein [Burkholderia cepacia]KWH25995.1 hypothetical protein WL99_22320 [Burkholderia cepacia]MDN7442241.1 DUF2158 domain-containing protein [Burkholderia cepacia]
MSELAKGDVVMLKSGGPEMTISELGLYRMTDGGVAVRCHWFINGEPKEALFDIAVLKTVEY